MADFTIITRNQMLDWLIGTSNPTPVAATRYLALYNGDPQAAGTEVTTTIRTAGRVAFTSAMSVAASGTASNSSIVDFGDAASGSTGTQFDHIAIFDAVSGGNLLASDVLGGGTQIVTEGNAVSIPASGFSISIS